MFMKAHVTGESASIAGEDTGVGKEAPILLDDEHDASASRITGEDTGVDCIVFYHGWVLFMSYLQLIISVSCTSAI
jgi:hypothetical protein